MLTLLLESTDSAISDIVSKIVAKNRNLISLDREVKKENEEGSKYKKANFLKVINNFFDSFFNSTRKTMARARGGIVQHFNIFNN